jgi:hypothetical protein
MTPLFKKRNKWEPAFHPWPTFFSFLFSNVILSYTNWPFPAKISMGLLFILVPTILNCFALLRLPNISNDGEELLNSLPSPPTILYWTLGAFLLFTQFYHLGHNPFWPILDDSREDYYGICLSQKWDGRLLYGEGQAQPIYFWLLGTILRVIEPTPAVFCAIPAILFSLTIPIAYWSAKKFLPQGISFFAAALGAGCLAERILLPRRWAVVLGLLTASIALDSYHYLGPYLRIENLPSSKKEWRVKAYAEAYQRLEDRFQKEGPGLIFHAFTTNYPDRSLETYSFHFNPLQNPKWDPCRAKWAAVICKANHQPFLEKRFPSAHWSRLGDTSGYYAFGIFPVEAFQPGERERRMTVNAAFNEANKSALCKEPADPWTVLEPSLWKARNAFGNDPFLHTVCAEKANQYFVILKDVPAALQALEVGLKCGYPSATLFNAKAYLLSLSGPILEARECYKKACAAPVNLTKAAERLAALDSGIIKTGND